MPQKGDAKYKAYPALIPISKITWLILI